MASQPFSRDARAVTPIVGVALMLGLTVALGGVIYLAVEEVPAEAATPPDGTATFEQQGGTVIVEITETNVEADSFTVRTSDSSTATPPPSLDPTPGASTTVSVSPGDTVSVSVTNGEQTELVGRYTVTDWDPSGAGPHSAAPADPNAVLDDMQGDGSAGNPYQIKNDHHLQAMAADPSANYVLTTGINATQTGEWNSGQGFTPISSFSGTLDGNGHTIRGLTINRPGTADVGLFATVDGGSVSAVALRDVEITGGDRTGAIAGGSSGPITDATVTGSVTGSDTVGTVVGETESQLKEITVGGSVSGTNTVGGVAGSSAGDIALVTTTASVTGDSTVGGVTGEYISNLGVGDGNISSTAARGAVSGDDTVGGITGTNNGPIERVYAAGSLSASGSQGGITADDQTSAGLGSSDIEDTAYYDTSKTAATTDGGGTGYSTDSMTGEEATSSMSGLDFGNRWDSPMEQYPRLNR